jgi:hypothetical protein
VETHLPADVGTPKRIAVAADAGDDARDEMARPGMLRRAETQRIEAGDGPRAHREHVAQNAADAGGRALIGLDVARMVVALHLEHDRLAVADVDDAGVLARALDHPRAPWSAARADGSRDDLYEQCSFHIAEKIPSSVKLGTRPISLRMRSYSSGFSHGWRRVRG